MSWFVRPFEAYSDNDVAIQASLSSLQTHLFAEQKRLNDLYKLANQIKKDAVTGNEYPGWVTYTLTLAHFKTVDVGSGAFLTFTDLPPNAVVSGIRVKHRTRFLGGAATQVQVAVGRTDVSFVDDGSPYQYSPLHDVGVAVADGYKQIIPLMDSPSENSDTSIMAYLLVTGDTVANLTQGEVDVSLLISVVP